MGKLLILFLSIATIQISCKGQLTSAKVTDCFNLFQKDSLIKKYIENGAERLQGGYNNPQWETYCDSIINICPNIADAYQLKAIPYLKNADYEKAFALNDKAVALDPMGFTAYRGFLKCIFTKDYTGAIKDFEKAQVLKPNSGEMDHTYRFYLAICWLELGNMKEAEKNILEDMRIQTGKDPQKEPHFNSLLYAGIIAYESKDYPLAQKRLLSCLKVYENLPEANYYLGMIYKAENNPVQQKKYLTICLQALKNGYSMSEDNLYYAYYPHQITLFEVENALKE